MARVDVEGVTLLDVEDGDTVLRASLRAGLGFPYACNVGSCGNCRFTLLDGRVEHVRADAPAWTDRDRERHRWLGCQSRPVGDIRIRVRLDPAKVPPHRPTRRLARLIEVEPVTHDLSEFAFEVAGSDEFHPGQYALLELEGVDGPRPYSMCNLPGSGQWRFHVKRVADGRATTVLFDRLRPGDAVTLDGPYGHAYLRSDGREDVLLVAGGSGLSPMVSIARALAADGLSEEREVQFFYGGRRARDLCAARVLSGLPDSGRRIQIVEAVSEPTAGWAGPTGFIHEVARDRLGQRLPAHRVYFAGPPPMVQAMQVMLYEAGVAPDRMHFDEFF